MLEEELSVICQEPFQVTNTLNQNSHVVSQVFSLISYWFADSIWWISVLHDSVLTGNDNRLEINQTVTNSVSQTGSKSVFLRFVVWGVPTTFTPLFYFQLWAASPFPLCIAFWEAGLFQHHSTDLFYFIYLILSRFPCANTGTDFTVLFIYVRICI